MASVNTLSTSDLNFSGLWYDPDINRALTSPCAMSRARDFSEAQKTLKSSGLEQQSGGEISTNTYTRRVEIPPKTQTAYYLSIAVTANQSKWYIRQYMCHVRGRRIVQTSRQRRQPARRSLTSDTNLPESRSFASSFYRFIGWIIFMFHGQRK